MVAGQDTKPRNGYLRFSSFVLFGHFWKKDGPQDENTVSLREEIRMFERSEFHGF
jgi:hypothetical protein